MAKQAKQTNNSSSIEEKLARICWNDNGWTKPSGENGKSKDDKTFECQYHFGFEEWLFESIPYKMDNKVDYGEEEIDDTIEIYPNVEKKDNARGITTPKPFLDGYQYGFLQQFNSGATIKQYDGKHITVHLFTHSPHIWIKAQRSVDIYIGRIDNVEVLNEDKQFKIFNHFFSTGRLTQMYRDVYDINGKWTRIGLLFTPPEEVFNIRFKLEDVHIHRGPNVLIPNYISGYNYRYKLFDFKKPIFAIDSKTKKPITIRVI